MSTSRPRRVDRHLAACSALATLGAAVALPPVASADIVASGPVSLTVSGAGNWGLDFSPAFSYSYFAGVAYGSIDGSVYEFSVGSDGSDAYLGANTTYTLALYFVGTSPGGYNADYLAYGSIIDSTSTWYAASPFTTTLDPSGADMTYDTGPWPSSGSGYLGVKLAKPGGLYYGWIAVTIVGGDPTITRWAYEDVPGATITAGAVPEPSSLALLAIGGAAAGLGAWRRRRRVEREDVG